MVPTVVVVDVDARKLCQSWKHINKLNEGLRSASMPLWPSWVTYDERNSSIVLVETAFSPLAMVADTKTVVGMKNHNRAAFEVQVG